MRGPVLVLSTVAKAEDGERLGRELVERRLAACVNVVPGLTSFYRWKGKVERDLERLLLIKTRGERFEELRQALVGLHPYELPELVALPVAGGHPPYLAWLDEGVGWLRRPGAPASGRRSGRRRPRTRR